MSLLLVATLREESWALIRVLQPARLRHVSLTWLLSPPLARDTSDRPAVIFQPSDSYTCGAIPSKSKALPVWELKSPQITKLSNSCNFITIIFMILKMFISSRGFNWWKVACTYPHRFCGAVISEANTNNVFVIVI